MRNPNQVLCLEGATKNRIKRKYRKEKRALNKKEAEKHNNSRRRIEKNKQKWTESNTKEMKRGRATGDIKRKRLSYRMAKSYRPEASTR